MVIVLGLLIFVPLGVLAFRRVRWAYALFVALGVLWIPARVGFHLAPLQCEQRLTLSLALHSLTNFKHIVLFAIFFGMTVVQLRDRPRAFAWATLACFLMGAIVEVEEGTTRTGHCRVRDVVPNTAGVLLGMMVCTVVSWFRRARTM